MDGMNRTWIVDSKIEQPTALALDLINKYVYWLDIYLESVEVVDYQGRRRQTITKGRQVGIYLQISKKGMISINECTLCWQLQESHRFFKKFSLQMR